MLRKYRALLAPMKIKIFNVKKWKNSGNRIRSNQNAHVYYPDCEILTQIDFENWLHLKYGKHVKYKIITGTFKI